MDFKWRIGQIDNKYHLLKYTEDWNDADLNGISVITTNTLQGLQGHQEPEVCKYYATGTGIVSQFEEQGFVGKSGMELVTIISNFFQNLNKSTTEYGTDSPCVLKKMEDFLEITIVIEDTAAAKATLKKTTLNDSKLIPSLLELSQELCWSMWYRGQLDLTTQLNSSKQPIYRQLIRSIDESMESSDLPKTVGIDLAKVFISRDKCFSLKQKMTEMASTSKRPNNDETLDSDFIEINDTPKLHHITNTLGKTTEPAIVANNSKCDVKLESTTQMNHDSPDDVPPKKRKFGKIIVSPSKRV